MTFSEVKKIRANPGAKDVDDAELSRKITEALDIAESLEGKKYIETPLDVGDCVYKKTKYLGVLEFTVINVAAKLTGEHERLLLFDSDARSQDDKVIETYDFVEDDIGDTVFLTREEAERH